MNLVVLGWEDILRMLIPMCVVLCTMGAVMLLLFAEGSRSRKLLAYVMLAWGVFYVVCVLGILFGFMNFRKSDILAQFDLISGNLYAIVLLWYPLEVVRPGWLTSKRCLLLMSPYLLVVGTYYLVLHLLGESPVRLADWSDFLAGIGQFNVWYRLVILFSVVAYIVYQLLIIYRFEVSYRQWCELNYASIERMEISWLRCYGLGVCLIVLAFFWILLEGHAHCYVAHNIIVQLFFYYVFFKGLFQENPYPEGFFRHTMKEAEAIGGDDGNSEKNLLNETVFLAKLPEYKASVQQWMEETKPYLRKDFKLIDVANVVPLNRTYLSLIFNEGWGTSFSGVVREYRIRHAETLLLTCPELTVREIALQCGFTSPSALHRIFAQCHEGMTPKQYRERCKICEITT